MLGWLDQKQSVSVATEEIYVCLRVVPSRCSLFVIAMKRRQPKCPSTAEWKHTVWPIHAVEYYLAIKRSDVLIQAATGINLENMMLSERSQTQKATYCATLFVWNVQSRQIHRDRNWTSD